MLHRKLRGGFVFIALLDVWLIKNNINIHQKCIWNEQLKEIRAKMYNNADNVS